MKCALWCVLLAFAAAHKLSIIHDCRHDEHLDMVAHDRMARGKSASIAPRQLLSSISSDGTESRQRHLAEATWRPMRIKVDYIDLETSLSSTTITYFKMYIIEPVVRRIAELLQVRARSASEGGDSHLLLGHSCRSWYPSTGQCAELDVDRECGASDIRLNASYYGAGSEWVAV